MRTLRVQQAIELCERIKTRRETTEPRSLIKCGRSWAPIAVNSLTAIDGHDRQYFNKLRACVVSPWIFVCYQRLMARKIAEFFGLNRGVGPFYTACCFDELSRGSFLCLLNASFKTAVSQRHNLNFEPKSMTMASAGVIRGEYLPNGGIWWHLG
jgi:hypothetical protein